MTALGGGQGSVSIIGAVSPPGGDFSEPVTQHTSRFIRCFWALDRSLANARHYPAIGWIDSYSEYVNDMCDWWRRKDGDWADNRTLLVNLLQEETSLQQIAKLVGPDALPDSQRLTLLVAGYVKNAFLQQNSFDEVDMYCSPEKLSWMMRQLAGFTRRAQALIKRGTPLVEISKLKSLPRLLRMKSEIPNGDTAKMAAFEQTFSTELEKLERKYIR